MTDEEFVQRYPTTPTVTLMAMLGCSRSTVMKRARRLGIRKDPEYKAVVQAANATGKTKSPETRAKIAAKARGRVASPEATAKRIASLAASGRNRGANHYQWKGGRPWQRFADPEYIAWRNAVLRRDDYRCQDCGRQCARYEKGLAAHHLLSYAKHPELRLDVDNGVTLCRVCHMTRHGRPPAPKELIPCACGCGEMIAPVDRYGRPRRFINYHHNRLRSTGQLDSAEPIS